MGIKQLSLFQGFFEAILRCIFPLHFSINIMFLSNIWEFQGKYPYHSHFLFLQGPPSYTSTLLTSPPLFSQTPNRQSLKEN